MVNIEKASADLVISKGSDILIGVSRKNLFSERMIKSMNKKPIVFALANPDPEINRKDALKGGAYVYASGRSDEKNQINNALVFPGFFKGLIMWKKKHVTNQMKVKAAEAIAWLIVRPTKDHFIPDIFERSLVNTIAKSLRSQ